MHMHTHTYTGISGYVCFSYIHACANPKCCTYTFMRVSEFLYVYLK